MGVWGCLRLCGRVDWKKIISGSAEKVAEGGLRIEEAEMMWKTVQ